MYGISKLSSLALVVFMLGMTTASAQQQQDEPLIGAFKNTWYFLAQEGDYSGVRNVNVRDMEGNVLARVSRTFKRHLDMEGSGKLDDGRVLNYIGLVKRQRRFHETAHAFGRGAGNCSLVPWHTIAVDPRYIPLGTVVRIDETIGMILPDGTIHDGLWRAEDTGSAIKGRHIDIFVGAGEDNGSWLARNGIDNMQPLTVRLVADPQDPSCVDEDPN